MKTRRFKVDTVAAPVIRVGGSEAIHALRVLRLKTGAEVILFDGLGREVTGRVCSVSAGDFQVEVIQRYGIDGEAGPSLVVASATPKGNRADWLVEKCAELGAAELWLLRSQRGEVTPGEGKLGRWRRKAVQAAKQTGHARTMRVEPPRTVADVLQAATGMTIFYGDPRHTPPTFSEALHGLASPRTEPSRVLIFIGPEGGLTDAEAATIEHAGGRPVRLAGGILRVETAAVAAASLWASWAIEPAD